MSKSWKNLGDIDFLDYGGCLVCPAYEEEEVKKYENLKSSYNVFYLNTDIDEEDKVYAALLYVDVDDYINDEDNKKDILTAIGLEDRMSDDPLSIMDRGAWAKEIVEYYGISNFSPTVLKPNCCYPSAYEDFLCSRDECKEWLKSLGAENALRRDPYKVTVISEAIENMKSDEYNLTRLKNDQGKSINLDIGALELLEAYYKGCDIVVK